MWGLCGFPFTTSWFHSDTSQVQYFGGFSRIAEWMSCPVLLPDVLLYRHFLKNPPLLLNYGQSHFFLKVWSWMRLSAVYFCSLNLSSPPYLPLLGGICWYLGLLLSILASLRIKKTLTFRMLRSYMPWIDYSDLIVTQIANNISAHTLKFYL